MFRKRAASLLAVMFLIAFSIPLLAVDLTVVDSTGKQTLLKDALLTYVLLNPEQFQMSNPDGLAIHKGKGQTTIEWKNIAKIVIKKDKTQLQMLITVKGSPEVVVPIKETGTLQGHVTSGTFKIALSEVKSMVPTPGS